MTPIRRRLALLASALALLVAPASRAADAPRPVRILSNWFAQADQGGYWQVQQDGLGRDAGLLITVQQGGPRIQTIPQVASGQAEFGLGYADDILLARLRGVPVRAVFAHMDYVPYTLVYHADPAVRSVTDLNGRPFAVTLGLAYWEWVKKRFALKPGRELPVSGDLGLFRNDPAMVQQGLSLYLPARMEAAGLKVDQVKVADLGYRPYYVLFTTDEMIARHPDVVRATVAAVRAGWTAFRRDPGAVKPLLMGLNNQIPPEINDSAVREMMGGGLLAPDPARTGCMEPARWSELAGQLASVGFLPAGFDPAPAFDLSFLSGC